MTLILDENRAAYQIRAFKPGTIQVNEMILTKSIIITPTHLVTDWPPQNLAELTREHFTDILSLKPAILLIGTGTTLSFPALELYGDLINQGIGVEIMNTSAACRTYNALASEERNVAAALLIQ